MKRKWSGWKKLYYTRKEGSPYFIHNGRRYHLNNFMRCNGIEGYEDADGYMQMTNFHSMLIHLSLDCEAVMVAWAGGE